MFSLFGLSLLVQSLMAQPLMGTQTRSEVCPAISFTHYLSQDGVYFQPSSGEVPMWVDLHFMLNGGIQSNVRMMKADTFLFQYPLNLREGDRLEFFFTYCVFGGIDCDTETFSEVFTLPEPEPFIESRPQPVIQPQPRVASVQVPVDQVLYVGPPQPVKHHLPAPSWGGHQAAAFASWGGGAVTQPFEIVQGPSWGGGHHGSSAYLSPLTDIEPVAYRAPAAFQSWGGVGNANAFIQDAYHPQAIVGGFGGDSWGGGVTDIVEPYVAPAASQASWGEPVAEPIIVQEELVQGNTYIAHAPPPKPAAPPSWGIHAVQPVVAAQDFVVAGDSWGGGHH